MLLIIGKTFHCCSVFLHIDILTLSKFQMRVFQSFLIYRVLFLYLKINNQKHNKQYRDKKIQMAAQLFHVKMWSYPLLIFNEQPWTPTSMHFDKVRYAVALRLRKPDFIFYFPAFKEMYNIQRYLLLYNIMIEFIMVCKVRILFNYEIAFLFRFGGVLKSI